MNLLTEIGNALFQYRRKIATWSLVLFAAAFVWTLALLVIDWSWMLAPDAGWLHQVWAFREWPGLLMLAIGTADLFWAAPDWTPRLGQHVARMLLSFQGIVAWLLLVALGVIVSLAGTGLLPAFLWRIASLPSRQIVADSRSAYEVRVPAVLSSAEATPVRLLENGHLLGPANAAPDSIRASGFGRYSFSVGRLLFSTSDNSNPIRNKRSYSIQAPSLLATPETERMLWLMTLGLGLLLFRYRSLSLRDVAAHGPESSFGNLHSTINNLKSSILFRPVLSLLTFVLPFVIFAFVAFGALPPLAVSIMFSNTIVIVLAVLIILYFAYHISGWMGLFLSLGSTLILFALRLSSLWQAGISDGTVIGGILPWSDSNGYYWGAQLLLAGANPNVWNGRRPWFMGLLAMLLDATGNDLRWTVALLVVLTALACFLLVCELQKSHGTLAAVVMLTILVLYYRRFIGTMLTENLGLTLGAIALAILWRSAFSDQRSAIHNPESSFVNPESKIYNLKSSILFPLGLFFLTIALIARAGAFFVLPAFLLWGIWQYRSSRRATMQFLSAGVGAIALAFIMDAILRHALVPSGVGFGNFSYSLYGVVTGDRGWSQVFVDHPELAALPEAQGYSAIYRLAWESVRSNPMLALSGILGTWRDYFNSSDHGVFSFVHAGWAVNVLLYCLASIGIVGCIIRRRTASDSMLLALVCGVLLSVPFAPPKDTADMRAYAATIPVIALLVALGAADLIRIAGFRELLAQPEQFSLFELLPIFGIVLVGVCMIGPLNLRAYRSAFPYSLVACPQGQQAFVADLPPDSSVTLVDDSAQPQGGVGQVRLSDFRAGIQILVHDASYPYLQQELEKLQAGQQIWFLIDKGRDQYGAPFWLITEKAETPPSGLVHVCASPTDSLPLRAFNIFYAQSITEFSGSQR